MVRVARKRTESSSRDYNWIGLDWIETRIGREVMKMSQAKSVKVFPFERLFAFTKLEQARKATGQRERRRLFVVGCQINANGRNGRLFAPVVNEFPLDWCAVG